MWFPGADSHNSRSIAERIRNSLAEMKIILPGSAKSIQITASFGMALFIPEFKEDLDLLIKKADDALYRAKSEGRNRVCVASEE